MKFCSCCVLPETRPNLVIDEDGVCNACKAHGNRPAIDWATREAALRQVVADAKRRSTGYDCLIPVSGGKDSTWQVVVCKEYGLNPLAVTWRPPGRSPLGQRNLDNLVGLGVDHIDYTFNPKVEAVFMRKAFERFGTPALPMHMGLYNMPLTLACRMRIPLVVWGENSADEYGAGSADLARGFKLTEEWLNTFGVTHGTTPDDWEDGELDAKMLTPYRRPSGGELEAAGVLGTFLGYYFPWSPEASLAVAEKHGFKRRPEGPKLGYYDFADLDDDFISVHHYLKWVKFGFTRLFDNLSIEIRNGHMTRDRALEILREKGEQRPVEDIERFCAFISISQARFDEITESFRNHGIWTRRDGRWVIDDYIVADWPWA